MREILRNGDVLTMDSRQPRAEAIVIEAGRIVFAGSDADAAAMAKAGGPCAETDLAGHQVIPGLIDMHAHLDREGLKRGLHTMTGLRTRNAVLDRIAALARAAEDGAWIATAPIGEPPFFFFETEDAEQSLYPNRWELDEVSPRNPVYIRPILGFWRWSPWPERLVSAANSPALDAVGIDRDTVPPSPSVDIERDRSNRPTGRFFERTTASIIELKYFSKPLGFRPDQRREALLVSQQIALSAGVTTVFEGHGVEPAVLGAYRDLHDSNELAIRAEVSLSPSWGSAAQPDRFIDRWLGWLGGDGVGDDRFRIKGLFVNPIVTADDAARAASGSYSGMAGYNFDSALAPPSFLPMLESLARNHIRAVGLTPRLFQSFDEAARRHKLSERGWLVQHCGHLPAEHAAIAARHRIGISFLPVEAMHKQAPTLCKDAAVAADFMPLRRLLDQGQAISIATDNIPASLFFAIWCCLARQDYRGHVQPDPDGDISREEALWIATMGGARCLGRDDRLGSISAGKAADLVVLDRDFCKCPLHEIPDIQSLATMVAGVWRHGDPRALRGRHTGQEMAHLETARPETVHQ
ncbi:amidohydrolase family protein [Roseiarcaceae bacterium H3SJ34-1]|uniref:amidohydrolase n=1 Tax=Terripilifer ovatus TaxID=3032367 RepID=UPI003AB9AC30|nr:amidohydrolase family protein [Roseiarcaceae bacterium H3SJ34-1]